MAYLAFSVPALAAGFASGRIGLGPTVIAYAIAVIVIGATAALVAPGRTVKQPVRS